VTRSPPRSARVYGWAALLRSAIGPITRRSRSSPTTQNSHARYSRTICVLAPLVDWRRPSRRRGSDRGAGRLGGRDRRRRTRESLLKSIARSRRWMEVIHSGKITSFDEIAMAESSTKPMSAASPYWRSCRRGSFAPSPMTPRRYPAPPWRRRSPCRYPGPSRRKSSGSAERIFPSGTATPWRPPPSDLKNPCRPYR